MTAVWGGIAAAADVQYGGSMRNSKLSFPLSIGLALAASSLLVTGCTEVGDPWYVSKDGTGGGGGGVVGPSEVPFSDVLQIFTDRGCVGCHGAGGGTNGLDVTTPESLRTGGFAGPAIVACNPDGSYLIEKVLPNPSTGSQMPTIGDKMTDDEVEVVRTWIAEGALETFNPAACVSGAVDYASEIAPLLNDRGCTGTDCHSGAEPASGLDLTSVAGILAGGEQLGPAAIPCDGTNSPLITKTSDNPPVGDRMPRVGEVLSSDDTQLLLDWINQGAGETFDPDACEGGPGPDPVDPVDYAEIQQIFTDYGCAGCHGGTSGLTVTTLEGLLAGGSVYGAAVTPCDGDGSVLVKKMRGDAEVGAQMPTIGDLVPPDKIQLVIDWIDQGAAEVYDADACN